MFTRYVSEHGFRSAECTFFEFTDVQSFHLKVSALLSERTFRIDDSRTLPCPFAQQGVRTSSPALNFSSEGLEDGFTYRFNVEAVMTSPRKDVHARVYQLTTGITALREDGLMRLESGMPIPVMLSVNSRNTKKIMPDMDMILSGEILATEFARGFQGTNGVSLVILCISVYGQGPMTLC